MYVPIFILRRVNHLGGAHRVFHFKLFSDHAEALIQKCMEDLPPLVLKLTDYFFALLILDHPARVDTLAATASDKNQRLM